VQHLDLPSLVTGASFDIRPEFLYYIRWNINHLDTVDKFNVVMDICVYDKCVILRRAVIEAYSM